MIDVKNKIYGFTLVEVLVVIAIIGILSSVALVFFNSTRASARDAVRLSDLRTTERMLEMYKISEDSYPVSTVDFQIEGYPWGSNWPGYGTVPKDPLSPNQDYAYVSDGGSDYQIYALFEREPVNPTFACAEPCGPNAEYNGGIASGTGTLIAFEPQPPPENGEEEEEEEEYLPPEGGQPIVCSPPFPEAMKGEQVYSVSGSSANPKITKVTIDPLDVNKFAYQTVIVSASDTAGNDITSLTGEAFTDNTSFVFELERNEEDNNIWQGQWYNEDEWCNNYQLAIRAVSASGSSEVVLTFR